MTSTTITRADAPDLLPISVSGASRDRGIAQGQKLAPTIVEHWAKLTHSFAVAGLGTPRTYVDSLMAETRFEEAIGRHAPHLLDEIAGIAAGSGLAQRDVYALQLLDEEWAYRARRAAAGKREKCSSLAIHDPAADGGRGATWIGQNMDLGDYTDGLQVVIRHAPDGDRPGMLLLTTAGVIALLGVNDAGVGVCVNSLPQLPNAPEGMPVAFVIRRLLECRSAGEAAEVCRELPHATNQHYLIADPDGFVSLECSAAGVTEYRPPEPDRILHTNHPLAGADAERYPAAEVNSVARLRALEARLARGEAAMPALQAALSSRDDPAHPLCRPGQAGGLIGFTTGSMISLLRRPPAGVESAISLGPPSERGYRDYRLTQAEAA